MNVHLTLKHCIITILLILCLSSLSFAADPWTRQDTYRELAFTAITAIDWSQTLQIADHPEKWKELNPLLGKHPSQSAVNTHFICGLLLHAGIAYLLPDKYRQWWQYGWIAAEAGTVARNLSIGIGIGF